MSGVKRWDHAVRWEGMKIAASYMAIKSGGKYVLASDYDRDTQRLSDESHRNRVDLVDAVERSDRIKAERDTFKAECVNLNNILDQIRTERDALRAQVEAMRAALLSLLTLDVKGHLLLERLQFSTKGREILEKVNAALQAKP